MLTRKQAFSSLDLSGLERLTDATAARIAKISTSLRSKPNKIKFKSI